MRLHRTLVAAPLLSLALVAAACSGDDGDAAPTTAAPADDTTTTAPDTTVAVTTTDAATTTVGATTTAPKALWSPVEPPTVPEETLPVSIDNELPDGTYYGTAALGESPGIVMELLQLLTGDACMAWAEANGEECNNDYAVIDDPQGYRPVADDAVVTVSGLSGPGTSYAIDVPELISLLQGNPPSEGAPDDYEYTPFPFIVTIDGGAVVRIEQWWVP